MNHAFVITLTEILAKYLEYANVFSTNLAIEILEYIDINNHAINLVKKTQLLYGFIYNLRFMKLKTLKAYIKTPLKTSFIYPSKFPVSAPILYDQK